MSKDDPFDDCTQSLASAVYTPEMIFHAKFLRQKKLVFANKYLLLTFSKGPTPLTSAVAPWYHIHVSDEVLVIIRLNKRFVANLS